jgi:hypothetical protein
MAIWPWGSAAQTNTTVYFLIGAFNDTQRTGIPESYVLPLSKPEDIAHARWLIAIDAIHRAGPENPLPQDAGALVVAGIAPVADGINRNYSVPGFPAWSWHVTAFRGFSDRTIEVLDGRPSSVEAHPGAFIDGIGFWDFTVAKELGSVPLYLSIEQREEHFTLFWSGTGTNVSYFVESAESLLNTNWVPVSGALFAAKTNQWTISQSEKAGRFYRVRAEPQEPQPIPDDAQ